MKGNAVNFNFSKIYMIVDAQSGELVTDSVDKSIVE